MTNKELIEQLRYEAKDLRARDWSASPATGAVADRAAEYFEAAASALSAAEERIRLADEIAAREITKQAARATRAEDRLRLADKMAEAYRVYARVIGIATDCDAGKDLDDSVAAYRASGERG